MLPTFVSNGNWGAVCNALDISLHETTTTTTNKHWPLTCLIFAAFHCCLKWIPFNVCLFICSWQYWMQSITPDAHRTAKPVNVHINSNLQKNQCATIAFNALNWNLRVKLLTCPMQNDIQNERLVYFNWFW